MSEILVKMENINKTFPGVNALQNCRFELQAGEVHALVGENGAGKSTMMKILAGVYQKDQVSGPIYINGIESEITSPSSAKHKGIGIIHQELNLMPHLTVAQNIYIGREPRKNFKWMTDDVKMNQDAEKLLQSMNLKIDPRELAGNLTIAKQQLVEIAKAVSEDAKIIIMDEPTAALTDQEIEELFVIIRRFRKEGKGIIYISHRMDELKKITDRVTVMRDGSYVDTLITEATTIGKIVSLMVGRTIYVDKPTEFDESKFDPNDPHAYALIVKNLNRGKVIKDVSFKLRKGEILGFAGLMGAGRTEVARAIFGADPIDSGTVIVSGKEVQIKSPVDAVNHGIAYLSEDRKRFGLALGLDVKSNIALTINQKLSSAFGVIKQKEEERIAKEQVEALYIKTPSINQMVRNLSGGNQQKVIIGKWLARNTDILIFDEPTRGIDVGAKAEIYTLLEELASQGKSIIMISSELPEILRMSNRIIVMCEGRITGEIDSGGATQESIMNLATARK